MFAMADEMSTSGKEEESESMDVSDEDDIFEVIKLRPSDRRTRPSNDEPQTTSGNTVGDTFVCVYKRLGCPYIFKNSYDFRYHHLNCSFSFEDTCHESGCFGRPTSKFSNFNELVKHYGDSHQSNLVQVIDGEATVDVTFHRQMLNVGVNEGTRIKHLGRLEWEDEGEKFEVVLVLLVTATAAGEIIPQIIAIIYSGTNEPVFHGVQLKMIASYNNAGKCIYPVNEAGGGGIENSNVVMVCQALASIYEACLIRTPFFTYSKPTLLSDCVHKKDFIYFKMKLKLTGYRCHCLLQSYIYLQQYAVSWDDIGLSEEVKRTMQDASDETPYMLSKILMPQIGYHVDIIAECGDADGIFNSVSAVFLQYCLNIPAMKKGRKVMAVVLFTRMSTLLKDAKQWKERGGKLGILVSVLTTINAGLIKSLKDHGCEILLTTPSVFNEALNIKGNPLSDVLVSKLKFVLLLDADYGLMNDSLLNFRRCMRKIPTKVQRTLFRIAVSPFVDKILLNELYSHGFNHLCNVLSLGTKPNFIIKKMHVELFTKRGFNKKIPKLVSIINENKQKSMRWIVFSNFDNGNDHAVNLVNSLEKSFGRRQISFIKNESDSASNPNCWDPLKVQKTHILITSYFALDYGILEHCDGAILYTLPQTKGDLVRIGHKLGEKMCYIFHDGQRQILNDFDIFK